MPSPVLLGALRGGKRVTHTQGDPAAPTRGLQLEGGSPRSVCQEGLSCIFSLLADDEQELLLRQHGTVGSLQQHLHWEGGGDAPGRAVGMGQRAGVGQQGWGVSRSRTRCSRVQGSPVGCGDPPPLPSQCRGCQACRNHRCFRK